MSTDFKEEFNQKCTKFLGWKYSTYAQKWASEDVKVLPYPIRFEGKIYENVISARRWESNLKFHSSWDNWLMEVVAKIEATYDTFHGYFGVHIIANSCTISGTKLRLDAENPHYAYFNEVCAASKLEATVFAVDQFLDWYYSDYSGLEITL